MGLTTNYIQQAISNFYSVEPAGIVQEVDANGNKSLMQLTIGNSNTKNISLENIPLHIIDGRIIKLGDIATVRYIEQEPTSFYRINGMNVINIVIYANSQVNHIFLANQLKAKIEQLELHLPKGYTLLNSYDSTEYISKELHKIYIRTIVTIVILLLFILIATRKFRYLIIILISIIANICISIGIYYLLGVEIHLYSLAGITISLGLIIDNTIVMVEHIRSRGNRRVFMAILAATVTTAVSLSALFFLDEQLKLNLIDFAIVVIINLFVSLASAWFFTPALCYTPTLNPAKLTKSANTIFHKKRVKILCKISRFYNSVISYIYRRQWIAWTMFVLGFGLPLFMLPNKIENDSRFADIYNKTIGSQWYSEKAKPIVDKIFGGSLRLFVQFVYEGSQWNNTRERTTLYMYAYMPPGATITQMNKTIEDIEKYLMQFNEIERFQTRINSAQNASITITFKEEHEFSYFPHLLKGNLITKSIGSGAADWSVFGVGDGFSNRMYETTGQYRIQLYGYNYDQLYSYAEDIRLKLLENQRIKEVNLLSRNTWEKSKNREFVLIPDIERLSESDISLPQYFSMVQNASGNERTVTGMVIDGNYQYIKYRAKQLHETDKWTLYNNLLHNDDVLLKLSSTAEMTKDIEQNEICKENRQYTMFISYDYIGSGKYGNILQDNLVKEYNEIFPLGYRAEVVGGWYWWQQQKKQYWLIILIILVMYLFCSILFESFWKPLAVISLVPFGFIGLFLTFYIFRMNFDQGGFAAMVLLCGLTINAAIYIINDYNNLKTSRCSSRRKYIQALHGKITPVMLTILSTILGLIPFVVGEHREPFWFALAAGTMGGLLFSLVGILLFLPLFFYRKR
ncbi:MAG: efflux RND transporter permease subunit [Marinilabiliaceae bacterium]|nr:efflux RND transporter permease subunit [Marinilabiliaceae bacterium]